MLARRLLGVATLVLLLALTVSGRAADGDKSKEPSVKDVEAMWAGFTQNDDEGTKKAFRDIGTLVRFPKVAVPFIKEKLKPVAAPDQKRIDKLIADLDHSEFAVREKAMRELETIGIPAGPSFARKLKEKDLPAEPRRRLEELSQKLDSNVLSAEDLRGLRAVEVLEGIGSPEAKAVLESLAKGAEGARLTEDAKRALANLANK